MKRAVMVVMVAAACKEPPAEVDPPRCTASGPLDASLTMSDVQALGTHNSYHLEPDTLFDASHAYSHPTLDAQADLGVRAFELDVHLRDDDTWGVFHLPGIDPLSTCPDFTECLAVLRAWSDDHACHTPITVWIEPKDELDAIITGLVPIGPRVAELDAAIASVWPDELVISPGDLGEGPLPDAIRDRGWPTLAEARGHILFSLLDTGETRDAYLGDDPTLANRTLFVDSDDEDAPYAAAFKIDNAEGEPERVAGLVAAGPLVTSNADGAGHDRASNEASFAASLAAGPHYLSSDFVVPGPDGYEATLPGGSPRCHPSRVPEGCSADDLEPQP